MTAARYCLENKTLSFANLNDTYRHFVYVENIENTADNSPVILKDCVVNIPQAVPVAERPVHFYKEAIRAKEVVQ